MKKYNPLSVFYILILAPIWVPLALISFIMGSLFAISAGAFIFGMEHRATTRPGGGQP